MGNSAEKSFRSEICKCFFAKVSYGSAMSRLRAFLHFCATANIEGEYDSTMFNEFP